MPITAGPFRIAESNELAAFEEVAIVDEAGAIVAGIWPRANLTEQMANARLLCASKKLYDLARRVAEAFEHTDAPLGNDARAVIGEVEGR